MTPTRYVFIAVFFILISSADTLAQESYVYDAKNKRDPFIPLVTDKVKFGAGMLGVESIDDLTLEGIVWDPAGESLVILNGMIMRENEQVNNVKIVKIESDKITISIDENPFTINLIEEEEGEKISPSN